MLNNVICLWIKEIHFDLISERMVLGMHTFIYDIFTNIATVVSFLLILGQAFKNNAFDSKQTKKTQAALGAFFGILGIVLMLFTIKITDTIIVDLRHVPIMCAAILGGPLSSFFAALMIAMFRVAFFGINSASITAFIIALVVGAGSAYFSTIKGSRLKKLISMFVFFILAASASLVYLISDGAKLKETLIFYWSIYLFGTAIAYFTCEYVISANSNFKTMAYYKITADNLLDMISTVKPGGEIVYVSPSVFQLFGYLPEEFIRTNAYSYMHAEDSAVLKKINTRGNTENMTAVLRMKRKDGSYVWVETTIRVIKNEDGSNKELVCVTRDISVRKKFEQELLVSNARFKAIYEYAGTGIVLRDNEGDLLDANPAYFDMLGYSKEEIIKLSSVVHPRDYDKVQEMDRKLLSSEANTLKSEIRYINKNQQIIYADVTSTLIPGSEHSPTSIIRVVNDISSRKQMEVDLRRARSEAEQLALIDYLTGLLNRRAFTDRLNDEIHKSRLEKTSICLILADIDHFKVVNDQHGHNAGDAALQKFAQCLSSICRTSDFIGRYGGEEFIVCLPKANVLQAERIAYRMKKAIEDLRIEVDGKIELKLTASFGVACSSFSEDENPESLIHKADQAMYSAKIQGRNRVTIAS